ncbi:MAG: HAMP domain-containing protein [Acidobacteria bacterium]|nr:HAMP domain-containing protein [Acidobacteriota bacterium]
MARLSWRFRLGIKAKQVAGVTTIVGLIVVILSVMHLAALARLSLEESESRGEMLAHAIYQRAREVVATSPNAYEALRRDPGIRSILESSIAYSKNVTYAAVLDPRDVTIAHSFPTQEGRTLPHQEELQPILGRRPMDQLSAIYSDRTFEVRQPLLLGNEQFGSIRIGVSTLLIRHDLQEALRPAIYTAVLSVLLAMLTAMLFAQWLLRPIHIIKSGLTRLGRGESGVTLDLPPGDEFGELGSSFNTISQQLTSVRTRLAAPGASLESAMERLEDAVAIFSAEGGVLFANSAMRETLPDAPAGRPVDDLLPRSHPYRELVERTIATRQAVGPVSVTVPSREGEGEHGERLLITHLVEDADRRFVGVLLVARDVGYLGRVQSTIKYSRKLAALGRLMAGVAHEVKNPLNAMTIHLELLRQKLLASFASAAATAPVGANVGASGAVGSASAPPMANGPAGAHAQPVDLGGVMRHVTVISDEIKRLDEVVQGFLRFTRPEELKLQPITLAGLIDETRKVVEPEAQKAGVTIRIDAPGTLPPVNGDPGMLRQAFLNLALNASQAMPSGGTLSIVARRASRDRVQVDFEDTGVGIAPENLEKIFDLYFTTKQKGSGIGLSMVYRILQAHDGDVEVQSIPGRGSRFRLLLPQA